jgi:hypothetical protein
MQGGRSGAFRRYLAAVVAVVLAAPALCALAAPADEVKALMEAGRAADAYALGKRSPEALGDPVFDFYFGIAAIDTGNAGDGVLALERYLLNFPDNASARLQLARGFFVLGEDARAREEFEELRKQNPPPDVLATIDRFLDAIRLRETRYNTSTGLYIEAGLGFDSNVNAGVRNAAIALPNLGDVLISPAGTKNGDAFMHLGVGGYVTHPVAPGVALFGTGQAEWKQHATDREFDQGNYNLSGGVSVLREKNLYRLGLNYNQITIDGDRYREAFGPSAEWQYQIDERQAFSVGGQAARYRYTGANSVRDADFLGVSLGYRRLLSHAWQPILSAAVNLGEERALATGRDDLSRRISGFRVGVSFTPAAKWGASIGYTYQDVKHKAQDVILTTQRNDEYHALDAALSYLFTRNLSVRAEALLSENRSNIQLYSFPREVFSVKLRYEFK